MWGLVQRITSLCLLFAISVYTQQPENTCNDRKYFDYCGSACPIGCDNMDDPPSVCPEVCVRGCFCVFGLIFEDSKNWQNASCVPPTQCEKLNADNICPGPNPIVARTFCTDDADCEPRSTGNICAEGKCCPSCRKVEAERSQMFIERGEVSDIPSCDLTGRYYAPKQCQSGDPDCWCVGMFGNEIPDTRGRSDLDCSQERRKQNSQSTTPSSIAEKCSGSLNPGQFCGAPSQERWFFDENLNRCRSFLFHGCGGGENKHENLAECQESCVKSSTEKTRPKLCSESKKFGIVCSLKLETRWYFDMKTGHCLEFKYGGCGGNDNNFQSLEDCREACDV